LSAPQLQVKPTAEKPEVAGERTHPDLPHVEIHGLRRQFFLAAALRNAASPAQGGGSPRTHPPDKPQLPKHNRQIAQQ